MAQTFVLSRMAEAAKAAGRRPEEVLFCAACKQTHFSRYKKSP